MTVFTFGIKPISTFEQYKREFSALYNGSKDITNDKFKTIDFHEDVIKQMYEIIIRSEHKMKVLEQEMMTMKLKMNTPPTPSPPTEEEKKKARYMELVLELREIENDLKFYAKEN